MSLENGFVGFFFFFSSRRRHTRFDCDWSSDVCSSDLNSRWPRAGERSNFHRNVASENRGVHSLPRSNQSEHALGAIKNGMVAGRAGENGLSDELPARTAGSAAVLHEGN